jgi:hypothetical protein
VSAWDDARLGGRTGHRFALGLWHPMYKLASLAWVPPASERRKLFGRQRYVYALNVTLTPNEVDSDRFAVTHDFLLTDLTVSGQSEGETQPFSVQLFETKTETRYMDFPIFGPGFGGDVWSVDSNINNSGIFTMPFILRRIPKIPAGSVLQLTMQSLLGGSVTVSTPFQVALGGYQ